MALNIQCLNFNTVWDYCIHRKFNLSKISLKIRCLNFKTVGITVSIGTLTSKVTLKIPWLNFKTVGITVSKMAAALWQRPGELALGRCVWYYADYSETHFKNRLKPTRCLKLVDRRLKWILVLKLLVLRSSCFAWMLCAPLRCSGENSSRQSETSHLRTL